jgi:hypothetical protein
MLLICALLWAEHLVDCRAEEPRDLERQRQRRRVSAGLDRDHRLTGYVEGLGHLSLRHSSSQAFIADPVAHDVKVP